MANQAKGSADSQMLPHNTQTFRLGCYVTANKLGQKAGVGIGKVKAWKVATRIPVDDHLFHPELYEFDPPHPMCRVSGMFLRVAFVKEVAAAKRAAAQ